MAKSKEVVLDVPVAFGGVAFVKKTARVGVSVEREELSLTQADKNLCERRLTGTIYGSSPGDQEGQGRLVGMEEDVELSVIADVKKLSLGRDSIGFGLTLNINGLDRDVFSQFAFRNGRLKITGVEDIPEESKDEDGEAEE